MSADECIELKNIKYKTMLLSPHTVDSKTQENISNLDELIKKDKLNNEKLPWSKLNKTMKINKINSFVDHYSRENKMNNKEKDDLRKLLQDSLNKKLLQKAKDVIYDKNDGIIKTIPNLIFNKVSRKHTIKNSEKKVSALKSLAPKKKTVKNKSDTNKSKNN
tara:strand:+ start:83 stop:568 length:486 start_codon:yes stop_codon:yes gene_type:complete